MPEAGFLFDPEGLKRSDRASLEEERLIWLLLTLIRTRAATYQAHYARFGVSERTMARDVAKIRELGSTYGFAVSRATKGSIRLTHVEGVPDPAHVASGEAADVLTALADALGDVVARSLQGVVDVSGGPQDRFLRIAAPRLLAQTKVAGVYGQLRSAWLNHARVRFAYPVRGGGATVERIVEPYLTAYYAGRYYLVGFDVRPNAGWRQFSLDRIAGTIARAGTFRPRAIPPAYRGEDALGLFKSAKPVELTVELSAVIAEAIVARRWQGAQRVERRPEGTATITLEVFDLGEGVRWAFGFGAEAHVVAPPQAVDLARALLQEMTAALEPQQTRSA